MSQETIIANTEVSFKDFLFKNKRNRTILWIAAVAIFLQWAAFKYFYPFASFIHGDSFSYIDAAYENLDINAYMIGYSKFLRLFSVFFKSDLALSTFQYIFIQISLLLFLFTLFYFYRLGNIVQLILLCFMVFNPLFLHLGNLISSDGMFLSLSLIWFTLLIWIIHKPTLGIIITHTLILFIAFTVRYNAMIYPLISFIAFWISKMEVRKKIIGISSAIFLCGLFIVFTSYEYKKLTGYWQYSPFSGWQMANNAMYSYRYVKKEDRKPVVKKYKELDKMIQEYFDSTRNVNKFPTEAEMASTYYMWSPSMPLFKYRDKVFANRNTTDFKKWASMGPLYQSYGMKIIKTYPFEFARYFIWPNANKYFAPPVEFLQLYNSGKKTIPIQTKNWFNYKTSSIKSKFKETQIVILDFYPILSGIVNALYIFLTLLFVILNGPRNNKLFRSCFLLSFCIWLFNASFTILASSVALRFQAFPLLLTCTLTVLLISYILKILIGSISILQTDEIAYT